MNKPNPQEIGTRLEERRRQHRDQVRRQEEALDALVADAAQALENGLRLVPEHADPNRDPEAAAREEDARRAIQARAAIVARRTRPAGAAPDPRPGEPPLRAALRGIVEDYAEPLTPSDSLLSDVADFSGIALAEADSDGLWAGFELAELRAIRAALPDAIAVVVDRAESLIVEELVAGAARLAHEYPDAPLPDAPEGSDADR